MKVRYTGTSYNLNNKDHYEVVDASTTAYKIRNDIGRFDWYSKNNFVEVKDKVSTPTNNTISPDLVSKIEKELKDTEQRMANLRKQLEEAKNPPTKNILLRASRKNPEWMFDDDAINCFDGFVNTIDDFVNFPKGLCMTINPVGDGFQLDSDYRWELTEDDDGCPVLMVFDKE